MVCHALIVEDNCVIARVAELTLNRFGLTTDIAHNGEEALALVRENDYDLILMDVHMPVMDGLEATRRIQGLQKYRDHKCPIIAVTASETKSACLEAGMDDYLSKPVSLERLRQALESVVNLQTV